MVALQIRNVPDDVRDTLAAVARSRGQSLQTYLLDLVTREAGWNRNIEILERLDKQDEASPESCSPLDPAETLAILDAARQQRDAQLLEACNGSPA